MLVFYPFKSKNAFTFKLRVILFPFFKNKYEPKFNSLEPCPNIECRTILFNQALDKVRDNKHRELKESHKKKHKTLSEYEAEAKKTFQRWIRERDFGLPCISCGNPKPKEVHASHFYAAGQYSGLIFDEDEYSSVSIRTQRVAAHDDHKIHIRTPDDMITTDMLLKSKFMVDTEEEVLASIEAWIAKRKKDKTNFNWSRK